MEGTMLPFQITSSYSPKHSRYSSRYLYIYIYYHGGKLTIKLKGRLRSMKAFAVCSDITIDPQSVIPTPQSKEERSKMY